LIFRVIVTCFLVLAFAQVASHGDTIGLFNDPAGLSCNLTDTYGLKNVYVVHFSPGGASASEFSVPKPACWTNAIYLSISVPWEYYGDPQTGMVMPYGTCRTGTTLVITVNFFMQGTSPACCLYPLLGSALAGGQVRSVDCSNQPLPAVGLVATINGDATCPCGNPVSVEDTTWGRVKALYSE